MMAKVGTHVTEKVSTWSLPKNRIASGLVSSRTLPSSRIAAPAWSSCCGFSSGGRVNMYGVWQVPTAATISPIGLLPQRLQPLASSLFFLFLFKIPHAELGQPGPQAVEV